MATCPTCQSSMPDDADFCGYCGKPLTAVEHALPSSGGSTAAGLEKPVASVSDHQPAERSTRGNMSDSPQDRRLWDRLGPPGKWSIGLGLVLPVLGWLAASDFSLAGILALIVVIPLWMGALRFLIFLGQIVAGQR